MSKSYPPANGKIALAPGPGDTRPPAGSKLEKNVAPFPPAGHVLLRTLYLSLDPYMRGQGDNASSGGAPVAIGEVVVDGTVSRVEASQHPDFQPGDVVFGNNDWQAYALSDGKGLTKLDAQKTYPSLPLETRSIPGFTACMGLIEIGQPQSGKTVVVAGASGSVGLEVGMIAKRKGCRVVGIDTGTKRCRLAVEELGFDVCIDRRSLDFSHQLAVACPKGIDVYFESDDRAVFNAVTPLLNVSARAPMCGMVSTNDSTQAHNQDCPNI